MNKIAAAFALILVGAVSAAVASTDSLASYVRPGMRWLIIPAGLLIVAAGVGVLLDAVRAAPEPDPERADDGHLTDGHCVDGILADGELADAGHTHGRASGAGWLLAAPVLVLLLVAPPALAGYTAQRSAPYTPPKLTRTYDPIPENEPYDTTLYDVVVRGMYQPGSLQDRTVRITGFVMEPGAGRFVLTRLFVSCCAADALPLEVQVRGGPPDLAAGQWVTVTASYDSQSPDDRTVPVLDAQSVGLIEQPSVPYER